MDDETKTNVTDETKETGTNTETETQDNEQGQGVDAEKIVEKLQKRIGKEQSEKNDYAKKLADAQKQLEEFKNGKSVSKLSEDEKAKQAATEKDNQIKELETKLKLAESTQQTDAVFKEAGFNVGSDVLNMVVNTDDEKTYANAKALIDFVNSIRTDTKQEFLKGKTPTASGKAVKTVTADEFNNMSYPERVELAQK
ncbi:capsid assembly scaffolding protein Gp46 family protein [Fructilactobacillus frigidiflavus]|uniref:capsid assembly scaffolding protein Gp46 family protein n=1 Tax=Fructilactobacillus frigidiflavus TaxID=3242688 RepID=UPI0037576038